MRAVLLSALLLVSTSSCKKDEEYDAAPASSAVASSAQSPLLEVGAALPDLSAEAHTGERIRLSDLKGKPLVVYFYPKDDTRGCTIEAEEIRDLHAEIQKTGATVLGVSTDGVASHKAFADKYQLPFLLLPDEDHRIAQAFGVPLKSGRASRVSFVIGRDGRVSKVFPNVTPKGHGGELLEALRAQGS